jgi:hypothetical protein
VTGFLENLSCAILSQIRREGQIQKQKASERPPESIIRRIKLKSLLFPILTLLPLAATVLQAQSTQPPKPKTTAVLVIMSAKQGVAPQQIMKVMPAEIRATVELYLNGRITQWFSRGDGRGVLFFLDAKDVAEAQALMEALPLHKENLVDYEYISVGPLMPLRFLMAGEQRKE